MERNNRHENKLKLPQPILQLIRSGPILMLIRLYNHILKYIKSQERTTGYLNQLKTFLTKKRTTQ